MKISSSKVFSNEMSTNFSLELLEQLEADADDLFKRYNHYLPPPAEQGSGLKPGQRTPLQELGSGNTAQNARPRRSVANTTTTSGPRLAQNIVTSLKEELAADASSNPQSSDAQPPPSKPRTAARSQTTRGRRHQPEPTHSTPAATSSVQLTPSSQALITECLNARPRPALRSPVSSVATTSADPGSDRLANAEALAVACAAAALSTEQRAAFLLETLRQHTEPEARMEALRLLQKLGSGASIAATALRQILELYPGHTPEFITLCLEVRSIVIFEIEYLILDILFFIDMIPYLISFY